MIEHQVLKFVPVPLRVHALAQTLHDLEQVEVHAAVRVVHGGGLADAVAIERVRQVHGPPRAQQQLRRETEVLILEALGKTRAAHEIAAEELVAGGPRRGDGLVVPPGAQQLRAPVGGKGLDIAVHDVGPLRVRDAAERLIHLRDHQVVAVHEAEVVPPGEVHAAVAGAALPAVIQRQGPHALWKARGVVGHDLARAVGRAVVDKEDLHILQGLAQQGVHTLVQKRLGLIDRDNHAQLHACASSRRVAKAIRPRISAR